MSMTTRQFNEIIDMLLGRVPLDMLDSKQQEGVTRVFVAAGFLMKHRLKLPARKRRTRRRRPKS